MTNATDAQTKLTNPTLERSANLIMRTHYLLGSAADAQWMRSKTISPDQPDAEVIVGAQEASSIRVQRVADPTFEAATDPARLELRKAVKAAEAAMAKQHAAMRQSAAILTDALAKWNGGL